MFFVEPTCRLLQQEPVEKGLDGSIHPGSYVPRTIFKLLTYTHRVSYSKFIPQSWDSYKRFETCQTASNFVSLFRPKHSVHTTFFLDRNLFVSHQGYVVLLVVNMHGVWPELRLFAVLYYIVGTVLLCMQASDTLPCDLRKPISKAHFQTCLFIHSR